MPIVQINIVAASINIIVRRKFDTFASVIVLSLLPYCLISSVRFLNLYYATAEKLPEEEPQDEPALEPADAIEPNVSTEADGLNTEGWAEAIVPWVSTDGFWFLLVNEVNENDETELNIFLAPFWFRLTLI